MGCKSAKVRKPRRRKAIGLLVFCLRYALCCLLLSALPRHSNRLHCPPLSFFSYVRFFKTFPLPLDYFISHFIELLPHFMLDEDFSHCRRNPALRDGLSTMDHTGLSAVVNQMSYTFQFAHVATDQMRPYFMVRNQSYFPY